MAFLVKSGPTVTSLHAQLSLEHTFWLKTPHLCCIIT